MYEKVSTTGGGLSLLPKLTYELPSMSRMQVDLAACCVGTCALIGAKFKSFVKLTTMLLSQDNRHLP